LSIFNQVMSPKDGAAWVTGASSGIGKALVLRLVAEGWTVYATARRTDRLEKIALAAKGAGRVIPAAGDVTDAAQMRLKKMIAAQKGHVALTASVAGYRGLPGAAPYSATKAGLIAMAEALAMDLIDEGVRISVINPGFVETDATAVNDLEMPFLQTTDEAAEAIVKGLGKPGFEIAFPWIFARILRLIGLLPNRAYFWAVRKATGWKDV